MRDGVDNELKNHGYDAYSIKKLCEKGENLDSDYSVIKYAQKNNMVLVTEDVDNIKGCKENNIDCVEFGQTQTLDYLLLELQKIKSSRTKKAKLKKYLQELKIDSLYAIDRLLSPKISLSLSVLALIIVFSYIGGEQLSLVMLPPSDSIIETRDLGDFTINATIHNYNQDGNGLIREGDLIQVDVLIINKHPNSVNLHYSEKVTNSGHQKWYETVDSQKISHKFNLTRHIPFEKSGATQLYLHFQFDEESKPFTGGVMTFESPQVTNSTIFYQNRVYTQSEYDYKIEKYLLYAFLPLVAIPIALVSIKTLRDILEDK